MSGSGGTGLAPLASIVIFTAGRGREVRGELGGEGGERSERGVL